MMKGPGERDKSTDHAEVRLLRCRRSLRRATVYAVHNLVLILLFLLLISTIPSQKERNGEWKGEPT